MKRLLLAACIVSLTACGGGKDDVKSGYEDKIRASGQSLVYSFPLADQVEVPTPSPVVLRFTSAVTDPATANVRLLDANGQPVAASMTSVDGDRGLILTPDTPLNPLTHYTIDIPELALADGKSAARSLHFTTRGLHQGPAASVGADTFDVLRRFPDGQTLPVADLSSLRLQLSQPLDRNTVKYGDAADSTISLVDANGQLVPARVLVGDSYLTIDPVNDMVGGAQYTLKIATGSAGLKSSRGLTLPATGMGANAWSWSFTPEDTRPPASTKNPNRDRARMVQIIDDTPMDSPLTGKRVNLVPMYSVLLGTEGSANPATPQASGYLAAELAHIPEHDETTPLRIDRGSLIKASSLPIYIGGEVPAGFDSGQVYMEFLSDATGYLIENPYSTNPEAPKLVRLMMDMGISAEGDIANGSVTQTLMHIELVGTALVEDGLMTLNAVGVVQPNILGTERATAVLSFYMQGLDDQVNAPVPPVDERALEVVSWTFGTDPATGLDKTEMMKLSDPIIVNFNRALEPSSLDGKVAVYKLYHGGAKDLIKADVSSDGASLIVKPLESLSRPFENGDDFKYVVSVLSGLKGIGGQELIAAWEEELALSTETRSNKIWKMRTFPPGIYETGEQGQVGIKSAFVMGVYPGYPCPLDVRERSLSQMVSGRCKGGMQKHSNDSLGSLLPLPADDLLPTPILPANRPIVIIFSKDIDGDSLFNDDGRAVTFTVRKIDPDNPDLEGSLVNGDTVLQGDTIKFYPDSPWEIGQFYSYTVTSNGSVDSPAAQCNANMPGAGLCGRDGYPVQTQILAEVSTHDKSKGVIPLPSIYTDHFIWEERAPSLTGGGPDLTQYFIGAEKSNDVLQLLRLPQGVDSNVNLYNDSTYELFNFMGIGAGKSGALTDFLQYDLSESRAVSWEADYSTGNMKDYVHDPDVGTPLDPGGVLPPANSAKVLSSFYGYRKISQIVDLTDDKKIAAGLGQTTSTAGSNIGCGWVSKEKFEDQSGCELYGEGFLSKSCSYAVPAECPRDKFTYLHGVLFADVESSVGGSEEVRIRIYPGHIVTTSFRVFTKSATGGSGEIVDTGYQVMRMRYPGQQSFVYGSIKPGAGGEVLLSAMMDLYMDAPYLRTDVVENKKMADDMHHNLYSYPVSMSLSGEVQFMSDGRMMVEQYNTNDVYISQRANVPPTKVDFVIPAGGSFLRYVSEQIK